jgi:hypothetical protein
MRGPGMFIYDGGLNKEIPLRKERMKLQFRAEFFDLFNRANLMNPGVSASSINGNGVSQAGPNVATGLGKITADSSNNGSSVLAEYRATGAEVDFLRGNLWWDGL